MSEDRRVELPHVPNAESAGPFISLPNADEVLPDLGTMLFGPDKPDIGTLFTAPVAPAAGIAAYAVSGEKGVSELEQIIRSRAANDKHNHISKYDAYYAPMSPIPPVFWDYRCGTCRFFNEHGDGRSNQATCQVVGTENDWFGGVDVSPQGWCTLWLPEKGVGWGDWLTDRLEGKKE